MKYHLLQLVLSYSYLVFSSAFSTFPLVSQKSTSIIPQDLAIHSSPNSCSPIIESIFSDYDFSCIDGCVVLSSFQSMTLTSLILTDIQNPLITCIQFNDIKQIEIDTLTLSNLIIQIDQSKRYFMKFSNIETLTISNLSITGLGYYDPIIMSYAIMIDSSVLSLEFKNVSISSTLSSNRNENPSQIFHLFPYVLKSSALMTKVSTLYIIDCYEQIYFENISKIEIDQIIYQQSPQSLISKANTFPMQRTTIQLRATLSIQVASIQILDKRDPDSLLNIDLLLEILSGSEDQTSITIGQITRQAALIQNKQIQSQQVIFQITIQQATQKNQTLKPNLYIHNIIASMGSTSLVQKNPLNPSLKVEIQDFNLVQIDSITVEDYFKEILSLSSVKNILIGSLFSSSSTQQNASMIVEYLISTVHSFNITFTSIILQNLVLSLTSYINVEDTKYFSISSLEINNSLFISSQFLVVYNSGCVTILNTKINNLALRMSLTRQDSESSIFLFVYNLKIEFNNFEMKSPSLAMNWIEGFQSIPLMISQNVVLSNNCTTHVFAEIHTNFEGLQLGFFESISFKGQIELSNSTIINCFSSLGGGCFTFNLYSNKISMQEEPQFYLSNVTIVHASSGYFGGAIFGSQIVSAIDVHFESCSSLIGGAIFLRGQQNVDVFKNITFANNVADIVNPNICLGIDKIKKGYVYEYNPSLQGTPLYLNPIGKYSDSIQFYEGILYIYELELLIDGSWYSSIPSSRTIQNQLNQELFNSGNLFPFVTNTNLLYNQIIANQTNFFILYDPTNSYLNSGVNTEISFSCSIYDIMYFQLDVASSKSCKEGMEQILFSNSFYHVCLYCGFSKAIYPSSSVCQTCDVTYFQRCYSNQTELNKGYWRSNYTMNTTLIETCSISMKSCNGGYGIGDSLCYEGHIGPQCLNCDIRGEYWGESYSMSGVYTCNKCSEINSNEIKIIIGLVLISLSLMVIIKGNFKATKNQIYADYLAKIKMIYIGSSLSRQQQMSTCIKVLLFNLFFSNLANSFTNLSVWKSLSETSVILNEPLVTQFFSFDCFLVNTISKDLNLGFANLVISIATPGVIFTAHLILGVLGLFLNNYKKNSMKMRTVVSSLILSFIYLYLIVFYPFIFELCLKSFYCIRLEGTNTFSQIDLSLNCGDSSNNSLQRIHSLATPVLCLIIIFTPFTILLFLYHRKAKLRTVSMMLTLGFLYREYKNQFFLWEFARIILKSICVFTQVALIKDPQLYGTIIALLLTLYLVLLNFKQPFQGKLFNRLEQISVSIQILSIQSGVLYAQQKLNHIQDGTIIQILFIGSQILNIIFIIYMLILIIFSFLQKQLIKLHRKWKIPFAEHFLPLYSGQLRINLKRFRSLALRLQDEANSVKECDFQGLLYPKDSQECFDEVLEEPELQIQDLQKQLINLQEFNLGQVDPNGLLQNCQNEDV